MEKEIKELNKALNQLYKRQQKPYDRYAAYCGLSSPAVLVLYALFESSEPITQNELATDWCLPKQTVNFTVSGLVKKGCLRLERLGGARNRKAIYLTEEGQTLCEKIIRPLVQAEERALLQMTETERAQFVLLGNKQCDCFEKEIGALIGKTSC